MSYVCAIELFKILNLILLEQHQKVQFDKSILAVASAFPCSYRMSLQPFSGQLELDHCQSVPLPMLVSTNMIIAKRIKLVSRSAQRAR
ncbi:CAG pathogenicity island protein [Trichinella spiralis]|uniref:CAG pathogenicity island protein n=1 Tax=Trichinella spiralis TaxID=6334 RepID=A0ABR3KHH6_TRISP